MRKPLLLTTALFIALNGAATAQQSTTTGSPACSTLYQQASDAASARVAADDKDIATPQPLKLLTCLDNILRGSGLNVVINLLDPTQLFSAIQGQICNAITSAWRSTMGAQQCGITLSGFNLGNFKFGSLGGGLSCPRLSFGGGGPPVGTIGVGGAGGSGALTVTGAGHAPTGYSLPSSLGLY